MAELLESVEPFSASLFVIALVLGIIEWRISRIPDIERSDEINVVFLSLLSLGFAVLSLLVVVAPVTYGGGFTPLHQDIRTLPYAALSLIFSWYAIRSPQGPEAV